jgi:hypothetical protein
MASMGRSRKHTKRGDHYQTMAAGYQILRSPLADSYGAAASIIGKATRRSIWRLIHMADQICSPPETWNEGTGAIDSDPPNRSPIRLRAC